MRRSRSSGHHRRPGGGDQPGPAHPVARSRARGHQEAQARRAAGIRSGAARPQPDAHGAEPHRRHQGPDGDDARGAGAQELLRAADRLPGREIARDRDRVRVAGSRARRAGRQRHRRGLSGAAAAPPSRSRRARPARGSPARSTGCAAKVAEAEGQGRAVSLQDQSVHRHQQHDAVEPAARRLQCPARLRARAEGRCRVEGADHPRGAARQARRSSSPTSSIPS